MEEVKMRWKVKKEQRNGQKATRMKRNAKKWREEKKRMEGSQRTLLGGVLVAGSGTSLLIFNYARVYLCR